MYINIYGYLYSCGSDIYIYVFDVPIYVYNHTQLSLFTDTLKVERTVFIHILNLVTLYEVREPADFKYLSVCSYMCV